MDGYLESVARRIHTALLAHPDLLEVDEPSLTGPGELWIDSRHWEIDMRTPAGLLHVVAYGPDDEEGHGQEQEVRAG